MDNTALFSLSYGLYVVTSENEKKFGGQIANTVFQITADPVAIAISLNKENITHNIVNNSKRFAISVLEQDTPMTYIAHFGFKSARDIDKSKGVTIIKGKSGCPIVTDYAVSFLECEVINSIDVFTHTVFIGKIVDAKNLKKAKPMTYAYYHQIKKGKTPPKATTYVKEQLGKENVMTQDKWTCTLCGWEYDPSIGDPDNGIAPGTSFEDIPEDWVCPVCGASKDEFEKS